MSGFSVGDRVRLRERGADDWIDPKLRLRAVKGTPATVVAVIGTALPLNQRSYRVKFDAPGRMKPMSEIIPVYELELVKP